MLKSPCPTSISGRSSSGEWADFFFQPLQLHLESADLLEEFGLGGVGLDFGGLDAAGEDGLCTLEQELLPAVDESRMNAKLSSQFVDGAVALESGQGDLGLEGCRVALPFACHGSPFPGS